MEPNEWFGDRLHTDPTRTRAARAAWVRSGSEACGCADCRDWLARRDDLIGEELRASLERLGIDADFDSAVRPLEDEEGCGFELLYHLVGRLEPGATDDELTAEAQLPDGVLEARLRSGNQLAPASWTAADDSLELRVRLAADEA